MWKLLALALLALVAGCLRSSQFACTTNEDCASGGTCEAVGFCSFADSTCAGGSRFGEFSGQYAGKCVGDTGLPDAGIDAPPDAPPDAFVCPAVYMPLAGAPHLYRSITSSAPWQTQKSACASDGGYLAIADDVSELTAIRTFIGNDLWVGVTDVASEGTYLTVLGAPATFLPWDAGQPDNAPGNADCVRANSALKFLDDKCSTGLRAVCECE